MSGALQAVFMNQRSFGPTPSQQAYITTGTFSWVAPAGVTSVSVVTVGSGGTSQQGGALSYKNNITVIPANSYAVSIPVNSGGAGATRSYFNATCVVSAGGGTVRTGDGGGNGGCGAAGGGAGGYAGNGGNENTAGLGGGGGGGNVIICGCDAGGGGGGGVGILGQGSSGAAGTAPGGGGKAGSGGSNGANGTLHAGGSGGAYGGGRGAGIVSSGTPAVGAVRIIWPGTTRTFPSTCTGDK